MEIRKINMGTLECYQKAWQMIKGQYWMLLLISFVGFLISGVTYGVLFGVMLCGIFMCFLQVFDEGKKVDFEQVFQGFNYFLPSLWFTALVAVPVILIQMLSIIFLIPLSRVDQAKMYSVLLIFFLVILVLATLIVCVHTLIVFSPLLIVDKKLSGWESIVVSSKAVWQNLGGIVSIMVVGFILSLLSNLLCCGVGGYFVLPIFLSAVTLAYREIFPREQL